MKNRQEKLKKLEVRKNDICGTVKLGKEKSGKWKIMKKGYRENGYKEKEKLGKGGICKNTKGKKEKQAGAELCQAQAQLYSSIRLLWFR